MSDIERYISAPLNPETEDVIERRSKVSNFISDQLQLGKRVLGEHATQVETISQFESRYYQQDALTSLWQAREEGEASALIHLATGLGKTSIAVFDYAKFRSEFPEGSQPKALFICHQESIIKQANERFGALLPETSRQFFRTKQPELPESEITFATFQSMRRELHRFDPEHFDYIIYDEAHHTKAETYERVVEYFKPKFDLALSATIDRMDERDITDHFGQPRYSKPLHEAMAEGFLADVDYTIVFDDAVSEAMKNGFKPSSLEEMRQLFSIEVRNEEILEKINEKKAEIRVKEGIERVRTIVYGVDIEHVEIYADLLQGSAYHSSLPKKRQEAVLKAFLNDEGPEDIISKDMLNEGVDIPEARLIVLLRTTESRGIFDQQMGRGLRKTRTKPTVSVLDFVANVERIAMVKDIEDSIRSYQFGGEGFSGKKNDHDTSPKQPSVLDEDRATHSLFIFSQEEINLLERYKTLLAESESKKDVLGMSAMGIIEKVNSIFPGEHTSKEDIVKLNQQGIIPGLGSIYKYFQSIDGFNVARGLEPSREFNAFSKKQVIELADALCPDQHMSAEIIGQLSQNDEFPSASFITKMFGSVVNFSIERSIEMKKRTSYADFLNEDIIELGNIVFGDKPVSRSLLKEAFQSDDFVSLSEINKRFGSSANFNLLRGIGLLDYRNMSQDELIERANVVFGDTILSNSMLDEASHAGLFAGRHTIVTRFGSAIRFNAARGLEPAPERIDFMPWSNEQIIEHANTLFPDKLVKHADINQASKQGLLPSAPTLSKRFGSIAQFNSDRGIVETERRAKFTHLSNDEIVKLANDLMPGLKMMTGNINQFSIEGKFPSGGNILKRFGSIENLNRARSL